jgi:hypothetical protein
MIIKHGGRRMTDGRCWTTHDGWRMTHDGWRTEHDGCKHERDPSLSPILRPATNFAVTWRLISVVPGIRLLRFRYVVTSATSIYLLGVAGFAAATDYSYLVVDGFTFRTNNFVFAIVNFVAATDCSPP